MKNIQTFNMNQDLIYSVIVPLYNEEKNVHLLLDKITDVMQNYKYEIILIDDASTDNTVKEILKYNHPNVKLLEFKKNYGQGSALMAGFDAAIGDYVITLDGDLQNDPIDIPMMVKKTLEEQNADLVVGNRQKDKIILSEQYHLGLQIGLLENLLN